MAKPIHSEEEIIYALKQAEAGTDVKEICRQMAVSVTTFYLWKRKFGGLGVWKLDRLSRSLTDLLMVMEKLRDLKVGFKSITENIDTTTPAGRRMMQMVGSFAEFKRAMLRERTMVGLMAARKEGRVGGRRPKLFERQQQEVIKLVTKGKKSAADTARLFNVYPATISRLLQKN